MITKVIVAYTHAIIIQQESTPDVYFDSQLVKSFVDFSVF